MTTCVMGLPAGALLLLAYIALGQEQRPPWPPRPVTPPEIKAETPPPKAEATRVEAEPFPVFAPNASGSAKPIEEPIRPVAPVSATNIIKKAFSDRVKAYTPSGLSGSKEPIRALPSVVNPPVTETKAQTPTARVEVPPFPTIAPNLQGFAKPVEESPPFPVAPSATSLIKKVYSNDDRVTAYTPNDANGVKEPVDPLPPVQAAQPPSLPRSPSAKSA